MLLRWPRSNPQQILEVDAVLHRRDRIETVHGIEQHGSLAWGGGIRQKPLQKAGPPTGGRTAQLDQRASREGLQAIYFIEST